MKLRTDLLDIVGTQPGLVWINDEPVKVSPLQWKILRLLARAHAKVVRYEEIARELGYIDPGEAFEIPHQHRVQRAADRARRLLPNEWTSVQHGIGIRLVVPDPLQEVPDVPKPKARWWNRHDKRKEQVYREETTNYHAGHGYKWHFNWQPKLS